MKNIREENNSVMNGNTLKWKVNRVREEKVDLRSMKVEIEYNK